MYLFNRGPICLVQFGTLVYHVSVCSVCTVSTTDRYTVYLYFSPNLSVFLIRTNPPGTPNGIGFVQPSPFQNASQNSVGFDVKFGAPGGIPERPPPDRFC
ncbi:hypothetical protein BHE74_00015061 [Ensete ventricosum]|nr:hypothetical protein GW17_00009925 [Ensete ventricosum]RWW76818.1 hypothetical protein BHE74_00015061 [Ensete ventricosum]